MRLISRFQDFPIPGGRIDARFIRNGKGVDYFVNAPDDITITFKGDNINFKRI